MAEEKNCINADEYLANNPFMRHNHMKIERISTECSEISMEVHPDGLNIMGMIHGGLLYSLADVVTGLTARADGRKYVTQSAHVNFIGNVSQGRVTARGILVRRGRVITIVRGEVTDENGKLLADVTADMFCVGQPPSWIFISRETWRRGSLQRLEPRSSSTSLSSSSVWCAI